MATPERTSSNVSLDDIGRRLEMVDEIENPIERFFKREQLLEIREQLLDETDPSPPPATSTPEDKHLS